MTTKKALITGISGQDGSYLAEFLLDKNYEVHGIVRRKSVTEENDNRIRHLFYLNKNIHTHYGDMRDIESLRNIIIEIQPDEVYNLAAQSHVGISFKMPQYTLEVNGMGVYNLLTVLRYYCPTAKMYQASSSEMFGNEVDADGFQRETTPMKPVSPYGCSKVLAHNLCNHYRIAYDMFICCGILMNHTSNRRGANFVGKKMLKAAVEIYLGKKTDKLELGNLSPSRDFGHSKDYIRAMWMMLQQDQPDDYVIASGESHTIEEFCQKIFAKLGMNYKNHIISNTPKQMRPHELVFLKGDSHKARKILGWKPEYNFDTLVEDMLQEELLSHKWAGQWPWELQNVSTN